MASPSRVPPVFVERVWGAFDLSPWFPHQKLRIGEVWYQAGHDSALLIKFLFTTGKLSVQVHPDDEYARRRHNSNGKTEMWHILAAEPGASVGLGLRHAVTREQLRAAAVSGEIESLMNWVEVRPGDTLYAPAGTIHAIGAGLALCEIQQTSDVTYRLYDYGRPRELHLEDGIEVASREPYDGRRALPLHSPFFETEELRWPAALEYNAAGTPDHFLIVLEGSGKIEGEAFAAGEVWRVPAAAAFPVEVSEPVRLLRTYRPV